MSYRKVQTRDVTDEELTLLKRKLSQYLRAFDAPYPGGCCSHHGESFRAGQLSVTLIGTNALRVLVTAHDLEKNQYGGHSDCYLTAESWVKVHEAVESVAGKISEECEDTLLSKNHMHMDYELEMEVPKSFRFAQEANSRLPGSGSLDRRNDAKFKRWDDWLEERLKIVDNAAIEVKP